jgi:hypothetical protein
MTADKTKAELLALRRRMFVGLPVEEIERLGKVAKTLLQL